VEFRKSQKNVLPQAATSLSSRIKVAYSTEQYEFLVKRFYQTQTASIIIIQHEFQVKFECRKAPRRSAMNRPVNKSEMTGHIINNKDGVGKLSEHQKTFTLLYAH
jgi:hypothetical protein